MNYKVVIDPGHGGADPGAVNGNIKEKDFTLEVSKYIYDRLKKLGIPVYITRNSDETLNRDERIRRIINAFGNNKNVILLSNHINAGGSDISNYEGLNLNNYFCLILSYINGIRITVIIKL